MRERLLLLVALAILVPVQSRADVDEDGGLWGVAVAEGSAGFVSPKLEKWRWWLEGQIRFRDDGSEFDQGFFRVGAGYQVAPKVSLWAGYGWFRTSPEGASYFNEDRIWQQLLWKPSLGPFGVLWRTRLEQRFLDTGDDTGWRFRQFVKLSYPLPRRFYLAAYDEVFIALNSTDYGADSGFDQNRLFAGVGWKANDDIKLELWREMSTRNDGEHIEE